MAIFINDDEARQLLSMQECIEAVEETFRHQAEGLTQHLTQQRIKLESGPLRVLAGRSYGNGSAGIRFFGARKTNVNHIVMFDAESGAIEAVIDATYASALRTGAATAIATKLMARQDADTLGVIGAGHQAAYQIEAIAAVRQLREVRVYSRTESTRNVFATEVSQRLGVKVHAVSTAEEAVRGSSIVTTITNSSKPVLDGAWLEPGVHVNAAGTNGELDARTVRRSAWTVVDNVEQALLDSAALLRSRAGDPYDAALSAVVSGAASGRPSPEAITLFLSRGLALEDVAACSVILKKATERGIGKELPF